VALSLQIAELISSSILLLLVLPLMLFMVYTETLAGTYGNPEVMGYEIVGTLGVQYVLIGVLLPDLLLTLFAAVALRRPGLLLFAPLFPAMRLVEAYICLRSIPTAWRTHSTGTWASPTRRQARSGSTRGRHRMGARPLVGHLSPPARPLAAATNSPIATPTNGVSTCTP
jgi:hypothetical protein